MGKSAVLKIGLHIRLSLSAQTALPYQPFAFFQFQNSENG